MKNIVLIIAIGIITSTSLMAQQVPLYTQYKTNMYVINPAVAGSTNYQHELRGIYRNQWSGSIIDAPETSVLTYNVAVDRAGIGFMAFSDQVGKFRNTGFSASYAYQLPLNDEYKLGIGIAAQLLRARLDMNLNGFLPSVNTSDPAIINAIDGQTRLDATIGAYLYSDQLFVGLSAPNILQTKFDNTTNDGLGYISRHFYLTAGYRMEVNNMLSFEPSFLVRKVAQAPFELDLNARAWVQNTVMGGFSYRTQEQTVAAMVGVQYKGFMLVYSQDFSYGDLVAQSQELTLGLRLNQIDEMKAGFEAF